MASTHFRIAIFMTLFAFPTSTFQWCYDDEEFQGEMSREGYSWCTPQYDLLYVKGFQRTQGTDDLRDFRKVKCCQPPRLHLEKPYTCTSADWDISFSRSVSSRVRVILFEFFWYESFFSEHISKFEALRYKETCKVLRKLSYNGRVTIQKSHLGIRFSEYSEHGGINIKSESLSSCLSG